MNRHSPLAQGNAADDLKVKTDIEWLITRLQSMGTNGLRRQKVEACSDTDR